REPGEGAPLDAAAHGPLSGDLVARGIGGQAGSEAGEGIRAEPFSAAPRLDLVARAVERAAVRQRVAHDDRDAEPVRDGGAVKRVPTRAPTHKPAYEAPHASSGVTSQPRTMRRCANQRGTAPPAPRRPYRWRASATTASAASAMVKPAPASAGRTSPRSSR